MNPKQIEELIHVGLPGAEVRVRSEDNRAFRGHGGERRVRGPATTAAASAVYKALGERMGGEIHALALQTLTPDELATRSH